MPREPSERSSKDIKPYIKPSPPPASPSTSANADGGPDAYSKIKTNKTTSKAGRSEVGRCTPWTSEELSQLFEHVIKHGTQKPEWDLAVPGRSGSLCYKNWV